MCSPCVYCTLWQALKERGPLESGSTNPHWHPEVRVQRRRVRAQRQRRVRPREGCRRLPPFPHSFRTSAIPWVRWHQREAGGGGCRRVQWEIPRETPSPASSLAGSGLASAMQEGDVPWGGLAESAWDGPGSRRAAGGGEAAGMFWPAARPGECPERRASGHQSFLLSPSEWQGSRAAGDDSGLALTSPTPGHWPPSAARKLAGEWHSQAAANLKIRRQLPLSSSSPSPYSTPCFSFMLLLFCSFFCLFASVFLKPHGRFYL